jgi:membrane protein
MINSFKEYCRAFIKDIVEIDLFRDATALAYVSLMGLVPSLAAFAVLIFYIQDLTGFSTELAERSQDFLLRYMTQAASEDALQFIQGAVKSIQPGKIGVTGAVGFFIALSLLLRQVELCFNKIFGVKKLRNLFSRFLYFLLIPTLILVFLSLFLGVISGFDLKNFNPFQEGSFLRFGIISKVLPFMGIFFVFTVLYHLVPNCKVKWLSAIKGAAFSTIGLYIASQSYGWFIKSFTSYEMIYGAIAAIPVFLLWLYILWLIILLGALVVKHDQK